MGKTAKILIGISIVIFIYASVKVSQAVKKIEGQCGANTKKWYIKEFKLDNPNYWKLLNWSDDWEQMVADFDNSYHYKFFPSWDARKCYNGIRQLGDKWEKLPDAALTNKLGKSYSYPDLLRHLRFIYSTQWNENDDTSAPPTVQGEFKDQVEAEGVVTYCQLFDAMIEQGLETADNAKGEDKINVKSCVKKWFEKGYYNEKTFREKFGLNDPISWAGWKVYEKTFN